MKLLERIFRRNGTIRSLKPVRALPVLDHQGESIRILLDFLFFVFRHWSRDNQIRLLPPVDPDAGKRRMISRGITLDGSRDSPLVPNERWAIINGKPERITIGRF